MKRFLAVCLALCLAMALFAVPVFAEGATEPTGSGDTFFANGTPITITAAAPPDGQKTDIDGLTAVGEAAYISWEWGGDVAQVEDGQAYGTLQAAIDAVQTSGKVTLVQDTQEDITIPEDKKIELVLNAKLTNQSDHTIVVKSGATLTISGSGTVDNVTHQKAAIHNEVGGTVILNGGTYTRSKENGINSEESGGNSFYNIRNYGTMTINEGVEVVQNGQFSSLIENGFYNGKTQNPDGATATMIINGGTFSGGINTIKNDDYGVLTIHDGTFSNTTQAAFLNWNVATVNGGTFSSERNCILNGHGGDTMDKGELKIPAAHLPAQRPRLKGCTSARGRARLQAAGAVVCQHAGGRVGYIAPGPLPVGHPECGYHAALAGVIFFKDVEVQKRFLGKAAREPAAAPAM